MRSFCAQPYNLPKPGQEGVGHENQLPRRIHRDVLLAGRGHEVYAGPLREAFDSVATPRRWMGVLEYVQSQGIASSTPPEG